MVTESQLHIVAVTCFIKKDGKFLILKRSDKEIANPGEWTVPGGKVEGSDTILGTLVKEIREETGLEVPNDFQFLGDTEFTRPDGYHVLIPRFFIEITGGEIVLDKNDFDDFAWVNKENLDEYSIIKGVKRELEELL